MTFAVPLVLAMLVQTPDFRFGAVVQDWVLDAASRPRNLDTFLPDRSVRLVRCLGSVDYDARELATHDIRAMGRSALSLLVTARRSTDPEIRNRAQNLLREIGVCDRCQGDGVCRDCDPPNYHYCSRCSGLPWWRTRRCLDCGGTGNYAELPEPDPEHD